MRKLLMILLLAPSAVQAGPREEVYAASGRCARVSDDRAWLDCYYGAAQPMRQQLHLVPAPAGQLALVPGLSPPAPIPVAPPPSPPMAAQKAGGLFGSTLETHMGVKAFSFDRNHKFTITLANGEVWRQADSDTSLASWTKAPSFYEVAIRQSSNTITMEIRGDSQPYHIARIR